jgi:hypothetical protein
VAWRKRKALGKLVAGDDRLEGSRRCTLASAVAVRRSSPPISSTSRQPPNIRSIDGAYAESPFEAISLHAVDGVDGASSTRFIHAGRGYAALPMRYARGLVATMPR